MSNSPRDERCSDQNAASNAATSCAAAAGPPAPPRVTITRSKVMRSPRVLASAMRSVCASGWKTTTCDFGLRPRASAGSSAASISASPTGSRRLDAGVVGLLDRGVAGVGDDRAPPRGLDAFEQRVLGAPEGHERFEVMHRPMFAAVGGGLRYARAAVITCRVVRDGTLEDQVPFDAAVVATARNDGHRVWLDVVDPDRRRAPRPCSRARPARARRRGQPELGPAGEGGLLPRPRVPRRPRSGDRRGGRARRSRGASVRRREAVPRQRPA